MPTDGWYPPAIDNPAPSDAGDHLGPVTVGVLHTTESDVFYPRTGSYFGHQNYPHFTVSGMKVWQHISIRKSAKALANQAGGVQTNREGVIQIEVVGRAGNPKWSDTTKKTVRDLMRWIESQTQIPRRSTVTFWAGKYGKDVPHRMSYSQWTSYAGWCGHQHVPENTHYDPGAIDIAFLLGSENPMDRLQGAIRDKYLSLPTEIRDGLGMPTSSEQTCPDGRGRFNHFDGPLRGSIYWTPEYGAFVVYGGLRVGWQKSGWETGPVGYPISDEYDYPGVEFGPGRRQDFEAGFLTWRASDQHTWLHRFLV